MKTRFLFSIIVCCITLSIQAQKPFKELGLDHEVEVLTLSNGRYVEHFTNDTLRQIGSVMFNTITNKVAYIIPEDELEAISIAQRDREVTRFMSVDPLAPKYPHNSPYAFSENRVIDAVELEGLEKRIIVNNSIDGYKLPIKIISYKEIKANKTLRVLTNELKKANVIDNSTELHMKALEMHSKTDYYDGDLATVHYLKYEMTFIVDNEVIRTEVDIPMGVTNHMGDKPIDYLFALVGTGFYATMLKGSVVQSAKNQIVSHFSQELTKLGIKHTAQNIVRIGRNISGKVIFLEKGNQKAGLAHIVSAHGDDFVKNGIAKGDIADFVFDAAKNGKEVGKQGTRTIYETTYKGQTKRVAVEVSDNGFIVGANPKSTPKN